MTQEHLYRPKGAGHSAPKGDRRDYVRPRQELAEAFGKWLRWAEGKDIFFFVNKMGSVYRSTRNILPDMSGVSAEEINGLLALHEGHPRLMNSGVFLSAAYNKSDAKEMVFSSDMDVVNGVGYSLRSDKRLIIKTPAGFDTLAKSRGIAVNHADIPEGDLGREAAGTIVNFGDIGGDMDGSECPKLVFWELDDNGYVIPCTLISYGKIGDYLCRLDMIEDTFPAEMFDGREKSMDYIAELIDTGTEEVVLLENEWRRVKGLSKYLRELRKRLGPDVPDDEVMSALYEIDIHNDIKRILTAAGRLPA